MSIEKTLLIENDVQDHDINTIGDFFEGYNLGKVQSITHSKIDNTAILKLEYWYDNNSAKNMYERIYHDGEARIVYDDPNYFTVKFLVDEEPDTADYRDDYIKSENFVVNEDNQWDNDCDNRCDNNYCDNHWDNGCDNQCDNNYCDNNYCDNEYNNAHINPENNRVEDINSNYLEDDVIENSINIDQLFKIVEEIKLQIIDSKKMVKTFDRRLGNISKKTNIIYKHHPKISKKSVWSGRLRKRII